LSDVFPWLHRICLVFIRKYLFPDEGDQLSVFT
jgi:hypothetical protein